MSDIATLFARDPLKLSNQDLQAIVARLRESRAAMKAGPAPKSPPKKKVDPKLSNLAGKLEIKF